MNDRIMTVTGVGKITAKPDLIVINMELEAKNKDYEKTMDLALKQIETLRNSLVSIGYKKEALKTTDFYVGSDYDHKYDENRNMKKVFLGYKCRHNLKLDFDLDMDLLGKTLYAITSSKSSPFVEILFSIKDKAAIENDLLENAVNNAKEKALTLSKATGVTLGKINRIDYSWGEIKLFSNTEYDCSSEVVHKMSVSKNVEVEPDDIDVSDSVTVVWSIE